MKNFTMFLMLIALAFFTACDVSPNWNWSGGDYDFSDITIPDFTVRVVVKTDAHPYFQQGHTVGFSINGVQGKELTLFRGTTYTFRVNTPGHPFYISTSAVGNGAGEVTNGVTNSMTRNETLSFTPNSDHSDLLYYQCDNHDHMGWKINIIDP